MTDSATTYEVGHFIDGVWTGWPETERHNPARPSDLVSITARGDAYTVAEAVAAARAAQPAWRALTGPARALVLTRAADLIAVHADDVAVDLVREEGKTLAEAIEEVDRCEEIIRFCAAYCAAAEIETFPPATSRGVVHTHREPLGVVGVITPWNFPLAIPCWRIVPALAMGNAVVAKPSQLTTVSTKHLTECLTEAGLPPGVLNLVHGSGGTVGRAIVEHPDVAAISFTGSSTVAMRVQAIAAARRACVQVARGAKRPLVVLDDADLDVAAGVAAETGFGLTGQTSTATSRVIATPRIHDALVERLVQLAADHAPGDGLVAGTRMGPVVSRAQLDTNHSYLDASRAEGCDVLCGDAEPRGLFQQPAVVSGVEPDDILAREDVFGPVVAVLRAADLDEAIELANAVPLSVAAGIVSADTSAVHRFVDRVAAGSVTVNRWAGVDLDVAVGHAPESPFDCQHEQIGSALDFYARTKSVYVGVG